MFGLLCWRIMYLYFLIFFGICLLEISHQIPYPLLNTWYYDQKVDCMTSLVELLLQIVFLTIDCYIYLSRLMKWGTKRSTDISRYHVQTISYITIIYNICNSRNYEFLDMIFAKCITIMFACSTHVGLEECLIPCKGFVWT